MPLAKCPRCNRTFHVHHADPDSWHAKRWPHLQVSEFVPDLCWSCRNERRTERHESQDEEEQDRRAS